MRSGEQVLFDAYQATGPHRALTSSRHRRLHLVLARNVRALAQSGLTAAEAMRRLSMSFEALNAAASANRSRHQPEKPA